MATSNRRAVSPLNEILFRESQKFDFYQAVKLLEIIHNDKALVGEGSEPEKEPVRFKSNVSLNFPASDIHSMARENNGNGPQPEMIVNLMGLAGCLGPLPIPYTELILKRVWNRDFAFRDFLDIFNHRLLSILYRAKKLDRIAFDFISPENSRYGRALFSLLGLGTEGLRERLTTKNRHVRDHALLFYTALYSQQPRSMIGLTSLLSDYFRVKVKGKQLCGMWSPIEKSQLSRIGSSSGNKNNSLGKNMVVGAKVFTLQNRFELHLGPLSFDELMEFLPTGAAFPPLYHMTRFYAGAILEFDFVLFLDEADLKLKLGSAKGSVLGWTSWLNISKGSKNKYNPVRLSSRTIMESINEP